MFNKYVQKYIYTVVEDKIEKKHQIEYENCRNVNVGGWGRLVQKNIRITQKKLKIKLYQYYSTGREKSIS